MRQIFLTVFSIIMLGGLEAQVTFQPKQLDLEAKGIIYNKETTLDLKLLQTNGYAVGFNIGKIKTYYLTHYYHIEIGELKHSREFRQQGVNSGRSPNLGGSQSFVFGKQNTLLALRGGYGQKRYFTEKAKRKGLSVGVSYEGGPTLGLLKPYYLDLLYLTNDGRSYEQRSQKYSSENHDVFLDQESIISSSGFSKGLGELSVIPGLHLQGGVHFDWGAFDEFVKALDAGIMVDFFFRKAPIMVEVGEVENSPLFINLFINLQFGKRS